MASAQPDPAVAQWSPATKGGERRSRPADDRKPHRRSFVEFPAMVPPIGARRSDHRGVPANVPTIAFEGVATKRSSLWCGDGRLQVAAPTPDRLVALEDSADQGGLSG